MGMAQRYGKTPAEILRIEDPYTAYCFDEACAVIASKMDEGEKPNFVVHYRSASELYSKILNGGG